MQLLRSPETFPPKRSGTVLWWQPAWM